MLRNEREIVVPTFHNNSTEFKQWFEDDFKKQNLSKGFYDLIHSLSDNKFDQITFQK